VRVEVSLPTVVVVVEVTKTNYGVVVGYGVIEKLTSRLTSHVVFALRTNSGAHLMVSSVVLIYVRLLSG
jgi:hypothetical protein